MTLPLGSKVRFDAILMREDVLVPDGKDQQKWISVPLPSEERGILIGYRTKSNGYTSSECDYDDGYGTGNYITVWNPTGYVKSAIVVTSLYKNPIFVPREAIKEDVDPYQELLMAVGNKYPNETRHQTALRYIRNAEIITPEAEKTS